MHGKTMLWILIANERLVCALTLMLCFNSQELLLYFKVQGHMHDVVCVCFAGYAKYQSNTD